MPHKFDVTDPRGYRIACSDWAWEHIIGNRPYMDTPEWERDIQRAVENPTVGIFQDADFDDRCVYYRFRIEGANKFLKVVVRIEADKTGVIVTAFPTFNKKPGEKLIWKTSKA